jgi:hypothetical protein
MQQPVSPIAVSAAQPPELEAVYQVWQRQDLGRLPASVRRIVSHFDGRRSVGQVLNRARISEELGLLVIRKLTLQGVIGPVGTAELACADTLRDLPALREAPGGFTAAEEAFFASEVEPVDEELPPSLSERVGLFLADLRMRLTNSPA